MRLVNDSGEPIGAPAPAAPAAAPPPITQAERADLVETLEGQIQAQLTLLERACRTARENLCNADAIAVEAERFKILTPQTAMQVQTPSGMKTMSRGEVMLAQAQQIRAEGVRFLAEVREMGARLGRSVTDLFEAIGVKTQ